MFQARNLRWFMLLVSVSTLQLAAQDCKLPILSSATDFSDSGFRISWNDFNEDVLFWEIEHGVKGFSRTEIPTFSNINTKFYDLSELESGKTYEIYLRTVCGISDFSDWNGPYFFNTAIDNSNSCLLDLAISDNNCPIPNTYYVSIDGLAGSDLGDDIILESVELIIEHPWPPDLDISLSSPSGQSISLSAYNGNGKDNYGNPNMDDCSSTIHFTDFACEDIQDLVPPLIGQVRPEMPLATLYDGTSADGLWSINICDRATGDLGILKYAKLNLATQACVLPPLFRISDIEGDQVTIEWQDEFACTAIELIYRRAVDPGQLSNAEYVICAQEEFTILDLEPGTEYILTARVDCGGGLSAPISCPISFVTACANSNLVTNFDHGTVCIPNCDVSCKLEGIWTNSESANSDWILYSGETSSLGTGPSTDVSGTGNYLYMENQDLCDTPITVSLISDCLTKRLDESCALTFDYHMYGDDIGDLAVQFSSDSTNWQQLFLQTGSQGDEWHRAEVSLTPTFDRGLIRITATSKVTGIQSDIAIDNIKLIGIDTVSPISVFLDGDGDGFGDPAAVVLVCNNTIGSQYVLNATDCDDTDPSVFPGAQEIRCNQIDENCNGMADDLSDDDLDYEVVRILSESCSGSRNGAIVLQAFSGQPPYTYTWSNDDMGAGVTDLESGVYFCTITDVGGCQIVTEPIFVDYEDILVYSVRELNDPSCFGENDGGIELRIDGGVPPYQVEWNNNRSGSQIAQLDDGTYNATISDAFNCEIVIDSITLVGPQVLTAGVILKRDNQCKDGKVGLIQIAIVGGTGPYDVNWSNGSELTIVNNLESGSYAVTITDANGCLNVLRDIEITEPDSISIDLLNIEPISCYEESDGFVDINVSGGTIPYSYFWSNGSSAQDLIGIPAGNYELTVTDVNSCSAIFTEVFLAQPEELHIEVVDLENLRCPGSKDGQIGVAVSGGNQPYNYNWGITDGEFSTSRLESLSPGRYSLTVVDGVGCKSDPLSVELSAIDAPLEIELDIIESVLCHGDSTGKLVACNRNGLLPLDYNWSAGIKSIKNTRKDTLTDLLSGAYNLTITDNEGCVGVSDSIIINSSDAILVSEIELIDNLCWTEQLGSISLEVEGGRPPYAIAWSQGSNGFALDGLENGRYTATITDANDCDFVLEDLVIGSPEPLELSLLITDPTSDSKGSIELIPSGGVRPYTYAWAEPISFLSSALVTELDAGNYMVTVIDENGCEIDTSIVLSLVSAYDLANDTKIKIYPNPSTGIFRVNMPSDLTVSAIHLFDAHGRKLPILDLKLSPELDEINLTNQDDGLYFIVVTIDNNRYYKKVLIVR